MREEASATSGGPVWERESIWDHGYVEVLGIDIGGSGIKAAPVDVRRGELTAERHRIVTPQPATPQAVADVVGELVTHFGYRGPIGATFPAVVKGGVAMTAANVHHSWIGTDASAAFHAVTGCPVTVLNDADAAGLAEVTFGAAAGVAGTVVMVTLGTGIGSAVFLDGHLVPNTELGHLEIDGNDAELLAADSARERESLSWAQWAHRVGRYLRCLESLLWPDLIIIGGGVSKKPEKFLPLIEGVRTPLATAQLRNEAGIVGAALSAVPTTAAPAASPAG